MTTAACQFLTLSTPSPSPIEFQGWKFLAESQLVPVGSCFWDVEFGDLPSPGAQALSALSLRDHGRAAVVPDFHRQGLT